MLCVGIPLLESDGEAESWTLRPRCGLDGGCAAERCRGAASAEPGRKAAPRRGSRYYTGSHRSTSVLIRGTPAVRRFRFLTVVLLLVAMLLSSAALAGYVCPSRQKAVEVPQMVEAGAPCCGDHVARDGR